MPKEQPRTKILVVDDERDLRDLLEISLIRMGVDVDTSDSVANAILFLNKNSYDLVITDMRLADGDGLNVLRASLATQNTTPVVVLTAYGSAENAVAALKAGAFDYLTKPLELSRLHNLVKNLIKEAPAEISTTQHTGLQELVGESPAIEQVRQLIVRLSQSMAPIAISGESGSGKEVAARAIHRLSVRSSKPFIAVNCGAIPENLMESEFFGYKKGAFTGADNDREGFFQAANGGTLLLDEVAELPLSMQVKLLRAIQERRIRKVGATVEEAVDVRIISATHWDLAARVNTGAFRQDLYYRLNVIELKMPALRDRISDIPLLAARFLAKNTDTHQPAPQLSAQAIEALQNYAFPGNVRELENMLERAVALCTESSLSPQDLGLSNGMPIANSAAPASLANPPINNLLNNAPFTENTAPLASHAVALPRSLPDYLDQVEREILERALKQTEGNRTAAAELLGISFRQMRYRLQRLGL